MGNRIGIGKGRSVGLLKAIEFVLLLNGRANLRGIPLNFDIFICFLKLFY
jgi:hypothetical protein